VWTEYPLMWIAKWFVNVLKCLQLCDHTNFSWVIFGQSYCVRVLSLVRHWIVLLTDAVLTYLLENVIVDFLRMKLKLFQRQLGTKWVGTQNEVTCWFETMVGVLRVCVTSWFETMVGVLRVCVTSWFETMVDSLRGVCYRHCCWSLCWKWLWPRHTLKIHELLYPVRKKQFVIC